jgi:hypothetical protein
MCASQEYLFLHLLHVGYVHIKIYVKYLNSSIENSQFLCLNSMRLLCLLLKRLVAGSPPRRSGFKHGSSHVGFVGKPEGKRPLGRPRRRWVDNIKMDGEIGWDGMEWIGSI